MRGRCLLRRPRTPWIRRCRCQRQAATCWTPWLNNRSYHARRTPKTRRRCLSDLNCDALDVVTQHLSPKEAGRLIRTSRALAVAATPRHPSWALLRGDVKKGRINPLLWAEACESAGYRGEVQATRWLDAQCKNMTYVILGAARSGGLPMLKWLRERTPLDKWDDLVFTSAVKGGNLEAMGWMHSLTPPVSWSSHHACFSAVCHGSLETLKWLRVQAPPCPWNTSVCTAAAGNRAPCNIFV